MTRMELNQEQRDLLVETLESALGELRLEVAGTDRKAYRDALKHREEVLRGVLDAAKGSAVESQAP